LAAEDIFDLAKTQNVGRLLTTAPYAFYPETSWRDDLELGAAELYLATASGQLPGGLPHSDPQFYLRAAAQWAAAYSGGPDDGTDSLNLYDASGLAHYELCRALGLAGNPADLAVTQADLLADLARQLDTGAGQAQSEPFGLGLSYTGGDL